MKRIYFLVAMFALLFQSCSIGRVLNGPPALDMGKVKVGASRSDIISVLGVPKSTEKEADSRIDMFEFVDGYSAGSKFRAIPYILFDVATLGITELIFWPIECSIGPGIEGRAVVTYGLDDITKEISLAKQDGTPWPGRDSLAPMLPNSMPTK